MLERIADDFHGTWWLRAAGEGAGPRDELRAALFRREFCLSSVPETAVVRVSAADRYRLYVNGQSVVSGPRKGDRWNHYYETIDIAPHLRPGDNALTARVQSFAHRHGTKGQGAPFSVHVSDAGMAFWAEGDAGGEDLGTSAPGWTAVPDPSIAIHARRPFVYAGAAEIHRKPLEPARWRESAPLGWPAAERVFQTGINPFGEFSPLLLKESPIPNQLERDAAFVALADGSDAPERVLLPAGQSGRWIYDAGEERTGYLLLRAKGRGGKILVTYAERFFPKDPAVPSGQARRDDHENGQLTGMADTVHTGWDWSVFDPFWLRAFRYVQIEAKAGEEPLQIERPRIRETEYPLHLQARFDFDDPKDKALWEISVRTLRRCMHETYEDCPYYEQLQYIMDTRMQMLYTYAVSGDTRMARAVLWDFHCSMLPDGILQSRYPSTFTQVIPAFSLYWIHMLDEYCAQTGDREPLRFYRPTVDAVLGYFDRHLDGDGMVTDLGYWDFCDWVAQWDSRAGVPDAVDFGPSAVHNLTYAYALQAAARVVHLTGRQGLAQEYRERAEEVKKAVYRRCFDPEKGLLREGPGLGQYSQHAQILAVLTGLFSGERAREAMNRVMDDKELLQCTFPWHCTMMRALEKAGLYDRSAELWPTYHAFLRLGLTTLPETPGDTRSDCHAWSAAPLFEFPRLKLGVRMGEPGWARIRIEPRPSGWKRFSGEVPTPKGQVAVRWEDGPEGFRLCADTPPGIPVDVALPDGRSASFPGGHIEM